MKLKNFLALMAVAFLATGFTSCDDDDSNDAPSYNNLSGDFYGANSMTVMGSTSYDSTCVAHVINQGNGKYSLVLPESTDKVAPKGMPPIPTITIKDLDLKETSKGKFTSEVKSIIIDVMPGKKAKISNFKLDLNKGDKTLTLSYGLQYGTMPLTIEFTFKTLFMNDFVVGSFEGSNQMNVAETTMPAKPATAEIELQSNGKYSITLPSASKPTKNGPAMEIPAITLEDMAIADSANTYSFTLDKKEVQANKMKIVITDIKGKVHGNKLNITYKLQPGKMPMEINNKFEGAKVK